MDPKLHIISYCKERIIATCLANVRDRANSLATPLIRHVGSGTCTSQCIEFRNYLFDKEALECLAELLGVFPQMTRIVIGDGCASEICMAGASISRLVIETGKELLIEGSLPRAMGHVNMLRSPDSSGRRLRRALVSFEPDHWAYDWSTESETVGHLPSVTNGEYLWKDATADGVIILSHTDEDMLTVEWSVRAENLKSTTLHSAEDLATFTRASCTFQSLQRLTISPCQPKGLTFFGRHLASTTLVDEIRSDGPFADSLALLKGFEEGSPEQKSYTADCTLHLAQDGVGIRLRKLERLCFARCKHLNLHILVDGCNSFERRRFDETMACLLVWFANLEALAIDITGDATGGPSQGCVPVGQFLTAVPRSVTDLRLSFGGAYTLICASNRLPDILSSGRGRLRHLCIEGWAAGTEAVSKVVLLGGLERLRIPQACASGAGLRNALRRRLKELDLGISLLGRRDGPELVRLIRSFSKPTGPSRLLIRNEVRPDMLEGIGRGLEAAGCFGYVYMSTDRKMITIWLALPSEEKDLL